MGGSFDIRGAAEGFTGALEGLSDTFAGDEKGKLEYIPKALEEIKSGVGDLATLQAAFDKEFPETTRDEAMNKKLEEIVNIIKKDKQQRLFGLDQDQTVLLNPSEIDYVYAENRKIYAVLKDRQLELRMKLYEVEEVLVPHHFMRFSKSVIGNLNRIERFDLSFNGNLCVYFHSGNKEYISRKYVNPIKEKLMMGGHADDR